LYIYSRSAANGKRAQCQGGAKNPVVLMEDADMEVGARILADSAFGCAGQRCLAASLVFTVGAARKPFTDRIIDAARRRVVGHGLDPSVQMGPVISPHSQQRIESLIELGVREGANLLVDGRGGLVPGYERGNFILPTILENVQPESEIARTEIFGPVLGLIHADTLDDAIAKINQARYGNMACIFTGSGAVARKFRYEVDAGNVGVNIGVAAPMAFFPFSGWKDSFFGVDHGQSWDAVNFFTQKKVVIERWPKEWSRKF
jgi:malonate-semialdehyde dehydrogenase (acetylating)/methylmalonate-semialdehyde dehydrogenase